MLARLHERKTVAVAKLRIRCRVLVIHAACKASDGIDAVRSMYKLAFTIHEGAQIVVGMA